MSGQGNFLASDKLVTEIGIPLWYHSFASFLRAPAFPQTPDSTPPYPSLPEGLLPTPKCVLGGALVLGRTWQSDSEQIPQWLLDSWRRSRFSPLGTSAKLESG